MPAAALLPPLLLVAAGCASETSPPEEVSYDAEAVTAATAEAITAAASLTAAVSDLAVSPPERRDGGMDGVDPCITFEWSPLQTTQVTARFAGCVLPSGEQLDGSASVQLDYDGVAGQLGIAADVTLGERSLDGFLVVIAAEGLLTLRADVHYADADTDVRLVIEEATLAVTESLITLDAMGVIQIDGRRYSADATGLVWEAGGSSCLPSSGMIVLTVPNEPEVTITFEEDASGALALIRIGMLPPAPLRPSCQGS